MQPVGEPGKNRRESLLVQCLHVSKRTGDGRVLFDDATVEIHRGDFVCLVGPSGSGKTTFFKLLLRLESPDGGQILFQGQNVQRMTTKELRHLRRRVGIVLQGGKLLPDRSVFENAALPLEAAGRDYLFVWNRVRQVLRLTGLERRMDAPAGQLTAAENQRLALARAIANEPLILLADEPTGMADEDSRCQILELLRRIHSRGVVVVLATNDPSLPAAFPGSRTASIDGGRFVEGSFTLRGGRRISAIW